MTAIVPHRNLFHIRLLYYPQWNKARGISAEQDDAQFQEFRDKYHETTQMQDQCGTGKAGMGVAHPQEKELAVEEIDTYFYYLTDTHAIASRSIISKTKRF